MNPYTRAAQFVIRLVGFGFVIVSVILLSSDLLLALSGRATGRPATLVLEAIPFLVGSAIIWKSTAMAARLTRDLDDE
jgi:hypothetical protein